MVFRGILFEPIWNDFFTLTPSIYSIFVNLNIDSGKFIHNTTEINIETTEVNIADGSMNDDEGNANVEVLKINVDLAKVKDKFVKININLLLFSFAS